MREQLKALDELQAPDDWSETQRRSPRHEMATPPPSQWRRWVLIASVFALTIATTGIMIRAFNRDSSVTPPVSDPWASKPPGLSVLAAPPQARTGATMTWTGDELVMWGGTIGDGAQVFNDGYAYRPEVDAWHRIPAAPLQARFGATAVWSGHEVLVWGGGDGTRSFADGAAFDPVAETWRPLADAPITGRLPVAAVWTGQEMLVWGSVRPEPGADLMGAAYDPVTNTWRLLPDAPFAINFGASTWTGTALIVVGVPGVRDGGPARMALGLSFDPRTDSWTQLPFTSLYPSSVALTWTGDEVFAVDRESHHARTYDPVSNAWSAAPNPPLRGGEFTPNAASVGGDVFLVAGGGEAIFSAGGWHDLTAEFPPPTGGRESIAVGSAFLIIEHHFRPPVHASDLLLWNPSQPVPTGGESSVPSTPSPSVKPHGPFAFVGAVDGVGGLYTVRGDEPPHGLVTGVGLVPSWSPDGGSILVSAPVQGSEGATQLLIVDASTGQTKQLTTFKLPNGGAWSPVRDEIAFATGYGDVYLIRADGTGLRQVDHASGNCGDGGVSWSPDGTQIAFARTCEGAGQPGIYIAGIDGTGLRRVSSDARVVGIAWSPDGDTLAFTDNVPPGETDVHLVGIQGGEPTLLIASAESPTWSPDGTMIAVVQDGRVLILDDVGNAIGGFDFGSRLSVVAITWSRPPT